jgi:hypothetical protein
MGKRLFLITSLFILSTLLLAACGNSAGAAPQESEASSSAEAPSTTEQDTATQATGLCANEYFPLRSDKTWKYMITSDNTTSDYSITFKDITETSFTAVQTFPNLTNEVTWQCGENGILSSSFANMNFTSAADVSIDTINVDGITLPPESDWAEGNIWDTSYTIQVTISNNDAPIQAEGIINLSNKIASKESVSVPAGTYPDSFRVDSTGEMIIDLMGTQTSMPLVYSTWYVKGVGMVKSASSDANLTYDMVLSSFE